MLTLNLSVAPLADDDIATLLRWIFDAPAEVTQ